MIVGAGAPVATSSSIAFVITPANSVSTMTTVASPWPRMSVLDHTQSVRNVAGKVTVGIAACHSQATVAASSL